jgi:hypothetical protein
MFQHGQTGLGIACIVLLFCCGIGALIAFIVGWMNARAWNITNVMIAWTVCWVINLGTSAYTYPLVMQRYNQVRPQ